MCPTDGTLLWGWPLICSLLRRCQVHPACLLCLLYLHACYAMPCWIDSILRYACTVCTVRRLETDRQTGGVWPASRVERSDHSSRLVHANYCHADSPACCCCCCDCQSRVGSSTSRPVRKCPPSPLSSLWKTINHFTKTGSEQSHIWIMLITKGKLKKQRRHGVLFCSVFVCDFRHTCLLQLQ